MTNVIEEEGEVEGMTHIQYLYIIKIGSFFWYHSLISIIYNHEKMGKHLVVVSVDDKFYFKYV